MTHAPKIVGSILQSGRLYKAGEEDALAKVLPTADAARLVAAGQLSGDWSPAPGEPSAEPAPEQPSTPRASTKKATKRGRA
jgi:hypothetical protein